MISDDLLRTIFETTHDGIVTADRAGIIRGANRAALTMFGYAEDEMVGQPVHMLLSPRERELHARHYGHAAELKESRMLGMGRLLDGYRKDGRSFPVEVKLSSFEYDGELYFSAAIRDDSERHELRAHVTYLSRHDSLTGMLNGSAFRTALQSAVEASQGRSLAVAHLSLDGLGDINSTYGHLAADKALMIVGERIKAFADEEGEATGRLTGTEFALFKLAIGSERELLQHLERMRQFLANPIDLGVGTVRLAPHVGISIYPEDGKRADQLLSNANAATNHAKREGRDELVFFSQSMREEAADRLRIETDLAATADNPGAHFLLHYQPQVSLGADRALVGFESLIRWQHPSRGMISPARFIPIAEDTGLIRVLGTWVVAEACRQLSEWKRSGLPVPRVSVNVSATQLFEPGFVELVQRSLRQNALHPECLDLEITESALMVEIDQAAMVLNRLKGVGVNLSLDDFGTGYSSLSYLRNFPFDTIKIDKSFVDGIEQDPKQEALVAAISNLSSALGKTVIAEGIESGIQARILTRLGCDEAQGYFVSRPLAANAVPGFITDWCAQNACGHAGAA